MQGPMAARRSRRRAAELVAHFTHTFLNDACGTATPAGVESANDAAFHIGNQDGHAVGGFDGQQQAGRVGDDAIAGGGLVAGFVQPMHNRG